MAIYAEDKPWRSLQLVCEAQPDIILSTSREKAVLEEAVLLVHTLQYLHWTALFHMKIRYIQKALHF